MNDFGPTDHFTPEVTPEVTDQIEGLRTSLLNDLVIALEWTTDQVTDQVAWILTQATNGPVKSAALMPAAGLAHLPHFREKFRTPLIRAGWLAMTDPASPNSPQRRYRITPQGQAWLDSFNALPKS